MRARYRAATETTVLPFDSAQLTTTMVRIELGHLPGGEYEVKDVEILCKVRGVCRLGGDGDIVL